MEGMLLPEDFGVSLFKAKEIEGGTTIEDLADMFINIISGKGTEAQNNVVCANAGMAIATVTKCTFRRISKGKKVYYPKRTFILKQIERN
jgi:anthranilate phosphoribosyltransferase